MTSSSHHHPDPHHHRRCTQQHLNLEPMISSYPWLREPLPSTTEYPKPDPAGFPPHHQHHQHPFTTHANDGPGHDPDKTFLDLDDPNQHREGASGGGSGSSSTDMTSNSSIIRWLGDKTQTKDEKMFVQGLLDAYQDVVKRERNPSSSTSTTTTSGSCRVTSDENRSPEYLEDVNSSREVPSSTSQIDGQGYQAVTSSSPYQQQEVVKFLPAVVKTEVIDEEEEARISTSSNSNRALSSGGKLFCGGDTTNNSSSNSQGHHRLAANGCVLKTGKASKRAVIDKRFSALNRVSMGLELVTEETAAKIEKKRERNRIAASKCRMKKLQRIAELEKQNQELVAENEILRRAAGVESHRAFTTPQLDPHVHLHQMQQYNPRQMEPAVHYSGIMN